MGRRPGERGDRFREPRRVESRSREGWGRGFRRRRQCCGESGGRFRRGEAVGRVDLGADILADDVGAVEGREDAVHGETEVSHLTGEPGAAKLFEARLVVAADVRACNEDTVGESQKALQRKKTPDKE